MYKHHFFFCGLLGWGMEIFWTGLNSLRRRQMKLMGHSSFWMFPIYGMAAFIGPLSRKIKARSLWLRGLVYAACIFLAEFLSGSFLKKYDLCPWDYSKAKLNYKSVIRLDYLPLWFLAGLFYERLLSSPTHNSHSR